MIKSGDTVPAEGLAGLTRDATTRMLLEQIAAEWPERPLPTLEHRFCERLWRFDVAFIDEKVAVEIEGGVWTGGRHVRGKGYQNDMTKYNRASVLGWRVIRVTPDQVRSGVALNELRGVLA